MAKSYEFTKLAEKSDQMLDKPHIFLNLFHKLNEAFMSTHVMQAGWFCMFRHLQTIFLMKLFKTFQKYPQCQFESGSGQKFCLAWPGLKLVCKSYQGMTLVGKKLDLVTNYYM